VAIEIVPINHDEHIHFVLLIFRSLLGKLNAGKRKFSIMMGITEPVWKKNIYIITKPIETLIGRLKRVNLMPNISVRQD